MKQEKTKILSFRVPVEVAEKVDKHVQRLDLRGGRQQLLTDIFIPAFTRRVKKIEKAEVA